MNATDTSEQANCGVWNQYWTAYGGWRALLTSSYFWWAVALTAISFPLWRGDGVSSLVQSTVPSMLGFSLGGYAMLLSFGSEQFQRILVRAKDANAPAPAYLQISAAFVHFLVVQAITLLLGLVSHGWIAQLSGWTCVASALNALMVFGLLYSVLTGLAATMWIFQLSVWFGRMLGR